MKSSSNLKSLLKNIDRKGYPAYKSTQGTYDFGTYFLSIDHVQGDPFASPSKLSIHVKGRSAGFPASFYDTKYKQVALCDHLTRLFYQTLSKISFRAKGSGKSGLFSVSKCGQQVLERTACTINPSNGDISVHFDLCASAATFPVLVLRGMSATVWAVVSGMAVLWMVGPMLGLSLGAALLGRSAAAICFML